MAAYPAAPAEGEDWESWSPAPCYGTALDDLRAVGAPLLPQQRTGAWVTLRWCRAVLVTFPSNAAPTRRVLSKLLADRELLDAWLVVLALGSMRAAREFLDALVAEP